MRGPDRCEACGTAPARPATTWVVSPAVLGSARACDFCWESWMVVTLGLQPRPDPVEMFGGTCCVCSYLETVSWMHGGKWPKYLAEASADHIKNDHEPACS